MHGSAPSSWRSVSAKGAISAGIAALVVGLSTLPTAVGSTGCATQETTPAPDAGQAPCNPGPFIFCQPVPDDQPGCNTDDGTSTWLTRLPKSTRYPVDCVANVLIERDLDTGDCDLKAVCKCVVVATPAPSVDGGADDADAAPPPPTTGESKPVWNCSP